MDNLDLEKYEMDIPFITNIFGADGDDFLEVADPGQRPVILKAEPVWETKDTEAALTELGMGCVSHGRQPTLQDAVEDPGDLFGEVEFLGNEELQRVLHSYTNENSFQIQALPSKKKKNPPYLVTEKHITTLNETPVTIAVSGAKGGHSIHVSLRYMDEISKMNAVSPCKNHQDGKQRPTDLSPDFNFYLTTECKYVKEDNHPTAVIDVKESSTDANAMFRFSIVFLCLNSCHNLHGKKTEIAITIVDRSNLVLGIERFQVRICKNVKRDHKELTNCSQKRKVSEEESEVEEPSKAPRVEDTISQYSVPCEAANGINAEPASYMFQVTSSKKEKLILELIDELGGKWYRVQEIVSSTMPGQ